MVETVVAEQAEITRAVMGIIIISLFIAIAMLCLGGWGFISSRKKHFRTSSSEETKERTTKDKDQHKTTRGQTLKMLIICFLTAVVVTGTCEAIVNKGWGFFDIGKKENSRTAHKSTENTFPWLRVPLTGWSIVGMNHYHQNGEKYLFVAMVKNGRCIVEEGADDDALWARLLDKATAAETGQGEDK